jgi:hypothetical protein
MRICPNCGEKAVGKVKGVFPYSEDHLQCGKCDSTYNFDEFGSARARAGRQSGRWKKVFPPSHDRLHHVRKSRYGVTKEWYLEQIKSGKCQLCNKEAERFCVEHCHETGIVRGVVCHKCNILIGYIENNRHLINRVYEWIDANSDTAICPHS